ncbi:MAG: hypothetical protein JO006_09100 [Paucibacter sp.]|nr:hypothetical protein [Roseateles sp.]
MLAPEGLPLLGPLPVLAVPGLAVPAAAAPLALLPPGLAPVTAPALLPPVLLLPVLPLPMLLLPELLLLALPLAPLLFAAETKGGLADMGAAPRGLPSVPVAEVAAGLGDRLTSPRLAADCLTLRPSIAAVLPALRAATGSGEPLGASRAKPARGMSRVEPPKIIELTKPKAFIRQILRRIHGTRRAEYGENRSAAPL